jgi:hypothetical protein
MLSVDNGHIRFHGLPVQIISEIGVAITALLADAPEKVRPSMREIMNRCFDGATTDDAIEAFLDDSNAYAEAVIKDTELFSMLSIMRELQEGLKARKEQEDDE